MVPYAAPISLYHYLATTTAIKLYLDDTTLLHHYTARRQWRHFPRCHAVTEVIPHCRLLIKLRSLAKAKRRRHRNGKQAAVDRPPLPLRGVNSAPEGRVCRHHERCDLHLAMLVDVVIKRVVYNHIGRDVGWRRRNHNPMDISIVQNLHKRRRGNCSTVPSIWVCSPDIRGNWSESRTEAA